MIVMGWDRFYMELLFCDVKNAQLPEDKNWWWWVVGQHVGLNGLILFYIFAFRFYYEVEVDEKYIISC